MLFGKLLKNYLKISSNDLKSPQFLLQNNDGNPVLGDLVCGNSSLPLFFITSVVSISTSQGTMKINTT